MSVTDMVLIIASLAIVFVIAKLNDAIKLLNNRINIISHAQKQMRQRMEAGAKEAGWDDQFDQQEREMRARLDKDFKF